MRSRLAGSSTGWWATRSVRCCGIECVGVPRLGHVQSVALRLVVDREREIGAFVAVEYWSIHARLAQLDTRAVRPRPDFLSRLHRFAAARSTFATKAMPKLLWMT